MIRELFLNTCILVAFIFISSQVFKNTGINPKSSLKLRLMLGGFCGALGIILMLFSIHVEASVFIDLRYVVIMLAAVLGGLASVILCTSAVAAFRILYFGLNFSSTTSACGLIALAIGCFLISKLKADELKKWLFMYFYSLIIVTIVFHLIISNRGILNKVITYYYFSEGIAAIITYYVTRYLAVSNEMYRRLKEESTRDFLTGLNNVRSFDILFNNAIETTKNKDEKLGILMIDIDFFKKVNDTYGHAAGDAVLNQLGKILISSSRSFDVVSRMGGEEFSVIMPDCTENQAREVGEKIRGNVENTKFILPDGKNISITVSVGIAVFPENVEDLEQILKKADNALYKAKQTGRNKVY